MTTQTIPVGSNTAEFSLGLGSYTATAVAGKYATISHQFTISQSDIEAGMKLVDLGTMNYGTHTFNVVVSSPKSGEFTVRLLKDGVEVETATTVNKTASFTVTANEHSDSSYSYTIEVSREGFKTVIEPVEATQGEFRLSAGESVPVTAGADTLTLTVKVIAADVVASVTVQ